ncbi:energy transducer TonB [Limnohabitans sp.]|uniref:energy transducer TonB n=1 Tax=Limnohabitans sp. TaxID=1907725 RepID=UPI0025BD0ABD|nr:energy transducer TonB [Limnohabitans sp.]
MRPEKKPPPAKAAQPMAGRLQQTSHRGLKWALGLSVAVHAGLVGFRFAAPEAYNRVFQDTPLEVMLVNARSQERPQEAQALAQVRLAGGGEVPEVRISSSPLPPAMNADPGMDISAAQKKIEVLKLQQMRLLTQLKDELAVLTRENAGDKTDSPDREAKVQRQQQLARQLAQIEQRVDQTQGAARKRYISPATQEVVYAIYYDKMRRTIEYQGTLNFPEAAGEKLYGQLTMVITVDSRGQLLSTEVARSSGNKLLDERAVAIVRNAAPFGNFNRKMRAQADQIVVVSRFNFSRDDTLGTRMLASEPAKP